MWRPPSWWSDTRTFPKIDYSLLVTLFRKRTFTRSIYCPILVVRFFRTMKYTQIVYCVFVYTSDSCGWWRSLLKILHQTTTTTHSLPQNGLANRSRGVVYMRDVCLIMSYDTVSCDVIGKKIDLFCTQILVNSLRRIIAVIVVWTKVNKITTYTAFLVL